MPRRDEPPNNRGPSDHFTAGSALAGARRSDNVASDRGRITNAKNEVRGHRRGVRVRVLLVDDHEIVRRALASVFEGSDVLVAGEAGCGVSALAQVELLRPDVVLMDVTMPGLDGIEATRELRARWPETAVLVLTASADANDLQRAVESGAAGYVLKTTDRALLIEAVHAVHHGATVFDPLLVRDAILSGALDTRARDAVLALTDRERAVLACLMEGLTNREIGRLMGYSVGTIKNVVESILVALQVPDRTAAAVVAARAGLRPERTQAA